MKKRIAIIGAGASGLIASITASNSKNSVVVFEKNTKVGKKILASGNGRCNITNKNISINNYYGENRDFVKDTLKEFGYKKIKTFFSQIGLEIETKDNSRCYPMSNQASSVKNLLEIEAKKRGVDFRLNCEVKSIQIKNSKFKINNELFDSLLIATGSLAMPNLGGSDNGYIFAKYFKHNIIPTYPSLVQLISNDKDIKKAAGAKIESKIILLINNSQKTQITGDLLFTPYGVSGSAILDISRFASKALNNNDNVELLIDLLPNITKDELKSLLQKRVRIQLDPLSWLSGIINTKLASVLIQKLKITQINNKTLRTLSYTLKNLKITIIDTKGNKYAEVMAGGVDTKEIDPKTMQSKLQKGLFFSGEVIDIDGDCGGYNLHWAWASGSIAGKNL